MTISAVFSVSVRVYREDHVVVLVLRDRDAAALPPHSVPRTGKAPRRGSMFHSVAECAGNGTCKIYPRPTTLLQERQLEWIIARRTSCWSKELTSSRASLQRVASARHGYYET